MQGSLRATAWASVLLGCAGLSFLAFGFLLGFVAVTSTGRLLGLLAVAAGIAAWLGALLVGTGRLTVRALVGGVVVCLVAGVLFVASAPAEVAPRHGRFTSVSLEPGARRSFVDVLPEADQVSLGIALAPLVDPHIDREQASRVRDVVLPLYQEMLDDPAARERGSSMGVSYAEAFAAGRDVGHYYLAAPSDWRADERLPLVVFLHGSAGNFQVYCHTLADVAEALRAFVVCPTAGFGLYFEPFSLVSVERATAHALQTLPVDPEEITLAAISQGGVGLIRLVERGSIPARRVVLLSAVIDKETPLSTRWRDKRVLLLHGGRDRRVKADGAREAAEVLRARGAEVTLQVLEDEDHFVFLTRFDEVARSWVAWARTGEPGR